MDPSMVANMMAGQGMYMGGGGGGWGGYEQQMMMEHQQQNMGPSMEDQIAAAKPMLKNIDKTTKKFIDTHCHIDTMYKKEGFNGDWDTYRYVGSHIWEIKNKIIQEKRSNRIS